jgi:uncharacterized protein (TIGR02284 family)
MPKSTDEKVTTSLIETLEDGRKGYAEAADKLAESDRPDLVSKFRELSEQRASFSAELDTLAAAYGDDIDEDGTIVAAVHRGWMSLKDALSGSGPDGVIEAAISGEEHAASKYEKALDEEISQDLRNTVSRQFEAIKTATGEIKALRDSLS